MGMCAHTAMKLKLHRYNFIKLDDRFTLFLCFGFLPLFVIQTRRF